MNRVEDLEKRVRSLSPDEMKRFRDWFAGFDAGAWDAQIAADVKSGRLDALIERARRNHESGRSSRL